MQEQSNFLYRTNYFKREWTWVRRGFAIFLLGIAALYFPLDDELRYLNFIFTGLICFYFISKPKDDLAVTNKALLHIKRSLIKRFTRIDKYEISEIKSIRCGGIHSDGWELVDFFNGAGNMGGYSNTVEITFSNGKSKSLGLAIDRKKLDHIVKIIYEQKKD